MSAHILKISQKYDAVFVPLQDDLNQEASLHGMSAITEDGIHLTRQGHRILAEKLYTLITSER
jgi:lysophospholipase L1-like esterase